LGTEGSVSPVPMNVVPLRIQSTKCQSAIVSAAYAARIPSMFKGRGSFLNFWGVSPGALLFREISLAPDAHCRTTRGSLGRQDVYLRGRGSKPGQMKFFGTSTYGLADPRQLEVNIPGDCKSVSKSNQISLPLPPMFRLQVGRGGDPGQPAGLLGRAKKTQNCSAN